MVRSTAITQGSRHTMGWTITRCWRPDMMNTQTNARDTKRQDMILSLKYEHALKYSRDSFAFETANLTRRYESFRGPVWRYGIRPLFLER
jgi:hypothetical protein